MQGSKGKANSTGVGARLLDELLDGVVEGEPAAAGPSMAEVTNDRHPTLIGRVQIRESNGTQRWCPTLRGLSVRMGDRVVVERILGFAEPVVVGVIDGFAARRETTPETAGQVELRGDEAVRIADPRGRPLVEIAPSEAGPVVRILAEDLELEVPGRLRISAAQLELRARAGNAVVEARDDVIARGETIHLN